MDAPAVSWPVLSMIERRILGVLIEKAKTTPEAYPMSLNALTNGCNQKSNRDPVMTLDESDVEEALEGMKPKQMVMQIQSGRVDRWRHLLYELWTPDKIELAILAELLLRGPQTEGELRTRVSRMDPVESLDELRDRLEPLVQKKLVVYLTPPRTRGATLTHGFHSVQELDRARGIFAGLAVAESPTPAPAPERIAPASSPPVASLEEFQKLQSEFQSLKQSVESLRAEFLELKRQLGG
jgi:uncharacterized protein YceH (UPF0502 family)